MTKVTRRIHFATKSRRKTAIPGPPAEPRVRVCRTPRVSKLMALAIRFDQLLSEGKVGDLSELARLAHVTQPRMTQIMNLLHLAPDIQDAILHLAPAVEGRDAVTEHELRPVTRIPDWCTQRAMWKRLMEGQRHKATCLASPPSFTSNLIVNREHMPNTC